METMLCRRHGIVAAVLAITVGAPAPARSADAAAAVAPVQQLIDGLLRIMKAGRGTPFEQRFEIFGPIVDQTFDLATVLQESVGLTWEQLPAEQQATLQTAFRRYTVASYVNSFDTYRGQRFEVNPTPRPVANGELVVETKIIPVKGDVHALDYVMRQVSGEWRAVDVLADGSVSRVAVQRSDFRRLLTRGGAEALAESLRHKSADLSGGAG